MGAAQIGAGLALVLAATTAQPAGAACNLEPIVAAARQTLPEYDATAIDAESGIVVVRLAPQGGALRFAVGLRSAGGKYFTSVMGARVDPAESKEAARIGEQVAAWYENKALQRDLEACAADEPLLTGESEATAVRTAATEALGGIRLGTRREALIVVSALLLSLAIALLPVLRHPHLPAFVAATDRRDLVIVLGTALVAVAIAGAVAWQLSPETDEVVTLGSRHQALVHLVSWNDSGEPFNPPGTATFFALWLRLADGVFWGRVFSIAIVPLTALFAYRAGRDAFGRAVGLSGAALVILAPSYLRLVAVARGYALIVCALCAILAAIAATRRVPARGAALGAAGLLALWMSYLLWPLTFVAPWIARLERRDRWRLTAAFGVMAAALAPRVVNGWLEGTTRTATFELGGALDAFGYALSRAAHAGAADYMRSAATWLTGAIAAALIAAGASVMRDRPRQLRNALLVVGLVALPILALLAGGRGIRERHVITLQVVLALWAAVGLGMLLSDAANRTLRALAGLCVVVIACISLAGCYVLLTRSGDWIWGLDRMRAGADLIMIVPTDAQFSAHAMLTGNSPLASEPLRWPPVCMSDSEWWCRRVDGVPTVSVDQVSDSVINAAAAAGESIWIFAPRGAAHGDTPPRLTGCERLFSNASWTVIRCAGAALR